MAKHTLGLRALLLVGAMACPALAADDAIIPYPFIAGQESKARPLPAAPLPVAPLPSTAEPAAPQPAAPTDTAAPAVITPENLPPAPGAGATAAAAPPQPAPLPEPPAAAPAPSEQVVVTPGMLRQTDAPPAPVATDSSRPAMLPPPVSDGENAGTPPAPIMPDAPTPTAAAPQQDLAVPPAPAALAAAPAEAPEPVVSIPPKPLPTATETKKSFFGLPSLPSLFGFKPKTVAEPAAPPRIAADPAPVAAPVEPVEAHAPATPPVAQPAVTMEPLPAAPTPVAESAPPAPVETPAPTAPAVVMEPLPAPAQMAVPAPQPAAPQPAPPIAAQPVAPPPAPPAVVVSEPAPPPALVEAPRRPKPVKTAKSRAKAPIQVEPAYPVYDEPDVAVDGRLSPKTRQVLRSIEAAAPGPAATGGASGIDIRRDEYVTGLEGGGGENSQIRLEVRSPGPDVMGTLSLAHSALTSGQHEAAISLYKQALKAEPRNSDALFGLATAYQRSGQNPQARTVYGRLLSLYPDHADGLNNFIVLASQESPEETLILLSEMERKRPDFGPIPAQIGMIHYRQGNLPEAARNLNRAIGLEPGNLSYRYNLAIVMDQMGDKASAITLYRQLLEEGMKGKPLPGSLRGIQERLTYLGSK